MYCILLLLFGHNCHDIFSLRDDISETKKTQQEKDVETVEIFYCCCKS